MVKEELPTYESIFNYNRKYKMVKLNPNSIVTRLTNEERNDRNLMKHLASINGETLIWMEDKFKNDKEIVRICIENCPTSFDSANPKILKNDKEFILSLLDPRREKKGIVRNFFVNDLDFMIRVAEIDGYEINYSSLKNNYKVALTAIKQNANVISILDDDFRKMKEFQLICVEQNGLLLNYFNGEKYHKRKEDYEEICWKAIKQNGLALEFCCSETFIRNSEFLKVAIKQNPKSYKWAAKNYDEVNFLAINLDGMNLEFYNKIDEDLIMDGVSQNGLALQFVKNQTIEICLCAVRQNSSSYQFCQFKDNEKLLTIVLNDNGKMIEYSSTKVKRDLKWCKLAVDNNKEAINLISSKIKNLIEEEDKKLIKLIRNKTMINKFN